MAHTPEEWFIQAEADYQTAKAMLNIEHYIYGVFMAHLSIEKALKGIYHKKFAELPPRTHSLSGLVKMNELTPPDAIAEFILDLDHASVATRYPEELMKLRLAYPRPVVERIVSRTKEVLEWAKKMF